MYLKQGQAFSIYGVVLRPQALATLDGFALSSNIKVGETVLQLQATVLSSADRTFRLDGTLPANLVGHGSFDVKFTKGGVTDFSQTVSVEICEAVS